MLDLTISVRRVAVLAAALAATVGALAAVAQVKTNVPDVVAGARPAIVERITIHGKALEGNLEGDAVDRDAIVFLPPGYNRTARAAIPSSMRCMGTRLAPSSGRMRFTCRRRSRARLPGARTR